MFGLRALPRHASLLSRRFFGISMVGKKIETLNLPTVVFPDRTVKAVSFPTPNKYTMVFFYPLDFTFVCPSEIIAFSNAVEEFKKRGVDLYGASCDSHFSHIAWMSTPRSSGGIGDIQIPLIADFNKNFANHLNVLTEGGVSLRGVYLYDKNGVLRHQMINDLSLGRSVEEALRVVDALQHVEEHGEVCPANWKKGQKAMKPTAAGVADYLVNNA